MLDWNTYPRPSLKREGNYEILNDGWSLNGLPIQLPFPPESQLSGYKGDLGPELTYQREILLPDQAQACLKDGGCLMLYFGAVDQVCDLFVNDQLVGHSELGYFKLSCDITGVAKEALNNKNPKLSVRLEVQDYLDHNKPYGKQRVDRGGMWYTPISGIWQTVWMEWLPASHICKVNYHSQGTKVNFTLFYSDDGDRPSSGGDMPSAASKLPVTAHLCLPDGTTRDFTFTGNNFQIDLATLGEGSATAGEGLAAGESSTTGESSACRYWTCESPYLYHITFEYGQDRVETYFALREVSIKEVGGLQRICINGKPVFFNGVLDQGYFQDGIFTPKSPEEYKKDIMRMKELGFNTLRKHIKVEPEIFYYLCDSLGIYLVQDMVNNGSYSFMVDTVLATAGIKLNDKGRYGQEQKEWFRLAAFETQNFLANNPSVIAYTVFNEGWGQTDSDQIGDELKERDPSRIYDYTSGWFKQTHSDVDSLHIYFRTKKLAAKNKALVLSEFGGFSRAVEGHIWNPSKSYGYGKCKDQEELTQRIIETYKKMVLPAIPKGLCACIYTQLSDIEDEINGFYTYDREVCKVDKEAISGFMKKII